MEQYPRDVVNPADLILFAEVADSLNYSRTAERLDMPKSTLSRAISRLEEALGGRLFLRSTRRLTLTEFGQDILEYARQIRQTLAQTLDYSQCRRARPSGRLRVTLPPDLANLLLADFFVRFVRQYPDIQLDLDLSARRVDLPRAGWI